ncbi:hypothetical protein BDR05DRAFT_947650 [Suillus weaverae]|nr:hypothetical protein BDR05DRAFT_947650 [Suillus weaverae]
MAPKWSPLHCITTHLCNSYRIETTSRNIVSGELHAQFLQAFIPRDRTKLAEEQKRFKEELVQRMESAEHTEQREQNTRAKEENKEENQEIENKGPNEEDNKDNTNEEGNESVGGENSE